MFRNKMVIVLSVVMMNIPFINEGTGMEVDVGHELQNAIELSKETPSHKGKEAIDTCPEGIQYKDLIRILGAPNNSTVKWIGKTWTVVRSGGFENWNKQIIGYASVITEFQPIQSHLSSSLKDQTAILRCGYSVSLLPEKIPNRADPSRRGIGNIWLSTELSAVSSEK